MRIKAVCEATGLTDRTVRYYIEEELISPVYTENYLGRKTFDFSESDINVLNDIAVLRKFGFSILEIKEMLLHNEEIPRIVSELRDRKQEYIQEQTELLQALLQLDPTHSCTVSELAGNLSAPVVNTPLPAEDTSLLKRTMKGCGIYALVRLGMIVAAFLLLILAIVCIPVKYTETTDIADYGTYTGTYDDSFVQTYINSFFPEEISSSYTDIKYSYKAKKFDTYAFEAYLEFTIEDETEFNNYIHSIASEDKWKPFPFSYDYWEYSIENYFDISVLDPEEFEVSGYHYIEYAKIKKVLYSAETQTIIYVAIGVYDGGGVGTDYLCVFFDRFGIDPVEYEQTADSPYMN